MSIRMSGLQSGLDTESIVSALMSVQKLNQTKIENKKTKLEWKQSIWKSLNSDAYSFYTDYLAKIKMQTTYNAKTATSSDTSLVTATAGTNAVAGSYTLKINQLATAQSVTSGKVSTASDGTTAVTTTTKLADLGIDATSGSTITVTNGSTTKSLTIDSSTTVQDYLDTLKDAGLNASYDTTQDRFFISSSSSGKANSFTITSTDDAAMTKLGLASGGVTGAAVSESTSSNGMSAIAAQDTEVIFNGATLTSDSTTLSANGLSLKLQGKSDDTLSITVAKDTSGVYDTIKEFITQYNSILSKMNTYYNADSASDYDVLSDSEKEAMSDDEVENWNEKIKSSLLRRDDTLSSLIGSFREKLAGTYTASNGKTYSLASIGISTSTDYAEGGLLHIRGDEDDTVYADEDNDLQSLLESDPDVVSEVLSGLAGNLYSDLTKKMSTTSMSSALTFYNDKEMSSQLSDYKTEISEWESRLSDLEDRYYSQFTAMETALATLNSQQSSLSNLLGG